MPFDDNKFANAAHRQARNYERKFRKYVPFSEVVDTLRRQAAFGLPLKFVVDRDSESSGFFGRGKTWDFGDAGVRFEKKVPEGSHSMLVVAWSDEYERKTLQDILAELDGLGFAEDALIGFELVSPTGERKTSRFGNGITVEEGGAVVHFTGAWEKGA